jgi:hypothetical protein
MMLEELQRRNYSDNTAEAYIGGYIGRNKLVLDRQSDYHLIVLLIKNIPQTRHDCKNPAFKSLKKAF